MSLSGSWKSKIKVLAGLFPSESCEGRICPRLLSLSFFLKEILFIYLLTYLREGEKHQCVVASHVPLVGDLACNPGMCPNWESNQWPFGSQASTQSTELHQPGPRLLPWFADGHCLLMSLHIIFPLCVSLCPNLPFWWRQQSHWISSHLNNLILTWLLLWMLSPNKVTFWGTRVKTLTSEFRGEQNANP